MKDVINISVGTGGTVFTLSNGESLATIAAGLATFIYMSIMCYCKIKEERNK